LSYGFRASASLFRLETTPRPTLPEIGEIFRPFKRFKGPVLPEQLLATRELSYGAKLTWAALARYQGELGDCFPRESTLAAELARTERSIQRYIAELRKKQLITVSQRGLNEPNHYQFLWHSLLAANSHDLKDPTYSSGPDPTKVADPDPTRMSGPFKEEENQDKRVSSPSIPTLPSKPRQTERPLPFTEPETQALTSAVEAFTYSNGQPAIATRPILAGIAKVIASYERTAYAAAAALHRVHARVERQQDNWPETPHWFRVVLRNEFQAECDRAPDTAPLPPAREEAPASADSQAFAASVAGRVKGMR
jgi:hypothetical protein